MIKIKMSTSIIQITNNQPLNQTNMNGFLKTILAGWGAKKLGGGCIGTILVFIIIYWLLGMF